MRGIRGIVFVVSCLLLVVSLLGCGQGVKSEISVGPGQPTGLSINGGVFESYVWSYSADSSRPISGASAVLSGPVTQNTTTDASGHYAFTNVLPGNYTVTVSKEGYITQTATGTFPAGELLDNTVLTMPNIVLIPAFVIESLTVSDEADKTNDTITIVFSCSVNTDTLVVDLIFTGLRASSATGSVAIDKSWDADKKQLAIKLRDGFCDGGMYTLRLDGQGGGYSKIKDTNGNALCPLEPKGSGYVSFSYGSVIYFTIFTGASSASVPVAPTNLTAKALCSSATNAIDFKDVNCAYGYDYRSGSYDGICLSWDAVPGAALYKIYASYDSGHYQYVTSYTGTNSGDGSLTPSRIDDALAYFSRSGSDYPATLSILPWPYLGKGIDFKITAVNAAGESLFSTVLNVKDNVTPEVVGVTETSSTEKRVYFTEPLDSVTAQSILNYTIITREAQTITSVVLWNNTDLDRYDANDDWQPYYFGSYVKLTITPGTWVGTVEVGAAVTDVTGNLINAAKNRGTF